MTPADRLHVVSGPVIAGLFTLFRIVVAIKATGRSGVRAGLELPVLIEGGGKRVRWHPVRGRLAVGVASVALLGGCSGEVSRSPVLTPSPTPALVGPSSSPPPSPPASPARTSTPSVSSRASATASPTASLVGKVVTTLADDGLRVRSQPRISDDSSKQDPLLPVGTALYVVDGPVSASGYVWYDVAPLTSRALPRGWIASADRDGQPWVELGAFDCPPPPTDFASLAALPSGVGLACFPRVPITVQARLLSCNCDVDGGWFTPSWFSRDGGTSGLLVAPDVTSPPANTADWFVLNLDPAGEHPDPLPLGKVVVVSGIFDHPAAATCTWTALDGQPERSAGCRLEFAVTRLLVQGP
jgi:hypothetical protein